MMARSLKGPLVVRVIVRGFQLSTANARSNGPAHAAGRAGAWGQGGESGGVGRLSPVGEIRAPYRVRAGACRALGHAVAHPRHLQPSIAEHARSAAWRHSNEAYTAIVFTLYVAIKSGERVRSSCWRSSSNFEQRRSIIVVARVSIHPSPLPPPKGLRFATETVLDLLCVPSFVQLGGSAIRADYLGSMAHIRTGVFGDCTFCKWQMQHMKEGACLLGFRPRDQLPQANNALPRFRPKNFRAAGGATRLSCKQNTANSCPDLSFLMLNSLLQHKKQKLFTWFDFTCASCRLVGGMDGMRILGMCGAMRAARGVGRGWRPPDCNTFHVSAGCLAGGCSRWNLLSMASFTDTAASEKNNQSLTTSWCVVYRIF